MMEPGEQDTAKSNDHDLKAKDQAKYPTITLPFCPATSLP